MKIKSIIASAAVALLAAGGIAVTAVPASAHTPEITSTCSSISATLTNYEYVPGTPAVIGTRVVTPAVAYQPAVYGEAPLVTPAVAEVNHTEWEYAPVVGSSNHWSAKDAGEFLIYDWTLYRATGNTRVVVDVPARDAVYGEPPLISAEVAAVAEVTEEYEVTPAVPAQDNSITLILDGVTYGTDRFGTSYSNTVQIDGSKAHTYTVIIDAIGTYYDKTITGKTTACPPVNVEVPLFQPTPPTCDAAGSLPFLGNPAAQNPNGYEFPGQGYRVYLNKAFTGAGTYTLTIQKIGAGFDPAFPYGTKVTGQTSQTLTVLPATGPQSENAEAGCYVAPPVEEEPEPTPEPTPTVEPTIEPTPAAALVIEETPAATDEALAQTGGVSMLAPIAGALGLIALGLGTVVARRRTVRQ